MKIHWRLFFSDIRVWIFLFMIVRLIGITQAPIDTAHSWRQITGNMVARNFLETDPNILYPRVDMAGEKSGITGTEFPLLNYIIYLLTLLFGWHHWIGRLVVLIVSSIGCWYFYKIIKRFWKEPIAFNATLLLLTSNWFIYSRKIMPDTFSVSICLIGVYYMIHYFDHRKWQTLIIAAFLILMGGLSKIPALLVVAPLGFIFFDKNTQINLKINFSVILALVMIPIVWWYFYWVPYLVTHFEYWHYYMGTSLRNGVVELSNNIGGCAEKFYFDALKYSGFGLFIWGLFQLYKKEEKESKLLKWIFFLEALIFFLFMVKAGRNFWVHSYYIIPFIPVMALVASYGLSKIPSKKWAMIIIAFIMVEGIANQQHDFRINPSEEKRLEYEKWADTFSNKSDLFIFNGGDNPKDLYFAHRKGWTLPSERITNNKLIDSLAQCGARYLWITKTENSDLKSNNPIAFENSDVIVYQLK